MDLEDRLELVMRPPTEEVVTGEELRELLSTSSRPKHYIGFEISGPLHLGSLFIAGYKLRDLLAAGFDVTVFLADWHSYINDKLGGDWDRIKEASKYYADAFREFAPGINVVMGSELYSRTPEYWEWLVRFAKRTTLARASRTLTIMGRRSGEALDVAQYIYPLMQSIDIRALGVDVAHAGMDQRKVHMLTRDVYEKLGWRKPVALHHHLLIGLQGPRSEGLDEDEDMDVKVSSKMSKSKPEGTIFVHDPPEAVEDKVMKAWCPQGTVDNNPVLEIARYIVLRDRGEIRIERPAKYGGEISYSSYEELARDYGDARLHPLDLKRAVARELNSVMDRARRRLMGDRRYLEVLGGPA